MKTIKSTLLAFLTGIAAYAITYAVSMFIIQDLRVLVVVAAVSFFGAGVMHALKPRPVLTIAAINLPLLLQTIMVAVGKEEAPFALFAATTVACSYLGVTMRRNRSDLNVRRVSVMVIAASGYLFLVGFVAMPRVVEAANTKTAGGLAPSFELASLDGAPIRSSDYAGKVLVINIWATTCSNCIAELPEFQRLYNAYKGNDRVEFLVVSSKVGMDTPDKVRRFAQRKGLELPWAHDTSGEFVEALQLENIPCTMIIDGRGTIRMLHIGYNASEDFLNNMTAAIDGVLAKDDREAP